MLLFSFCARQNFEASLLPWERVKRLARRECERIIGFRLLAIKQESLQAI